MIPIAGLTADGSPEHISRTLLVNLAALTRGTTVEPIYRHIVNISTDAGPAAAERAAVAAKVTAICFAPRA